MDALHPMPTNHSDAPASCTLDASYKADAPSRSSEELLLSIFQHDSLLLFFILFNFLTTQVPRTAGGGIYFRPDDIYLQSICKIVDSWSSVIFLFFFVFFSPFSLAFHRSGDLPFHLLSFRSVIYYHYFLLFTGSVSVKRHASAVIHDLWYFFNRSRGISKQKKILDCIFVLKVETSRRWITERRQGMWEDPAKMERNRSKIKKKENRLLFFLFFFCRSPLFWRALGIFGSGIAKVKKKKRKKKKTRHLSNGQRFWAARNGRIRGKRRTRRRLRRRRRRRRWRWRWRRRGRAYSIWQTSRCSIFDWEREREREERVDPNSHARLMISIEAAGFAQLPPPCDRMRRGSAAVTEFRAVVPSFAHRAPNRGRRLPIESETTWSCAVFKRLILDCTGFDSIQQYLT